MSKIGSVLFACCLLASSQIFHLCYANIIHQAFQDRKLEITTYLFFFYLPAPKFNHILILVLFSDSYLKSIPRYISPPSLLFHFFHQQWEKCISAQSPVLTFDPAFCFLILFVRCKANWSHGFTQPVFELGPLQCRLSKTQI